MKIVGANTLTGYPESLDKIPSRFLNDNDFAIVKDNGISSFYRLKGDSGLPANVPDVIVPDDVGVDSKRWILLGITANEITTETVSVETILSTGGITIENDIIINGNTSFNVPLSTTPPFSVNNNTLIDNLNAEFLDGHRFSEFAIVQKGVVILTEGINTVQIPFNESQDNVEYLVFGDIANTVDVDPSIYTFTVTERHTDYCVLTFSGNIDSPNYRIMWVTYPFEINHELCGYPNHAGATPEMAESVSWNVIGNDTSPSIVSSIGCYISTTFEDATEGYIYDFTLPSGSGIRYSGPSGFPYTASVSGDIPVTYQVSGLDNSQVQMQWSEVNPCPGPWAGCTQQSSYDNQWLLVGPLVDGVKSYSSFITVQNGCYLTSTYRGAIEGNIYDFGVDGVTSTMISGPSAFPYTAPSGSNDITVLYRVDNVVDPNVIRMWWEEQDSGGV